MKLDVQLDARPDEAATRARELLAAGVDGLFTFEGPHDVFLPLIVAAGSSDVPATDLMTNVAIALPRSPMHLANLAYDLQLLSQGRFRLGLGSQIKPHIENRYGSEWSRPAARMRETVLAVKTIIGSLQYGTRLDIRGEFTKHTLMPPTFVTSGWMMSNARASRKGWKAWRRVSTSPPEIGTGECSRSLA